MDKFGLSKLHGPAFWEKKVSTEGEMAGVYGKERPQVLPLHKLPTPYLFFGAET